MQYSLENNTLKLSVKKPPFFVRVTFYFFTVIAISIPFFMTIYMISSRVGLQFGYFIGVLLSGLIFFYFLRVSLWNTFGVEIIKFDTNSIKYEADYRWFKDGKKSIINQNIILSILPVGYEEDKSGVLIIRNHENHIYCSSKIPIDELHIIINKLNQKLKIQ